MSVFRPVGRQRSCRTLPSLSPVCDARAFHNGDPLVPPSKRQKRMIYQPSEWFKGDNSIVTSSNSTTHGSPDSGQESTGSQLRVLARVAPFASMRRAITSAKVIAVAVVMLVAPVASSLLGGSTASASSQYSQMHFNSGLCADDPGYSLDWGTGLDQWTCVNQSNEMWVPILHSSSSDFMIKNQWSGLCMNVNGNSSLNGAAIIQWPCNYQGNELFYWMPGNNGHRLLRSTSSGKCINIEGNSLNNGARLVQWDCMPYYVNEWVDVVWP